jgi:predicted aspartyl protease
MRSLTIIFILVGTLLPSAHGSVALSALDQYLVAHGYAGAQFVQHQNTYRLPISVNGEAGDLTIDTGAPASIVYTTSLSKFGLTGKDSGVTVHGVFGKGSENVGITTIPKLQMGNCTLLNVKAAVISAPGGGGLYTPYGSSSGLLGLREMIRYGAVLDLANHLLLVHPGGPAREVSPGIRSLLTSQGYAPIDLEIVAGHLRVPAAVNGAPCHLLVDTGAFLTTLDAQFARTARIGGHNSGVYAHGFGAKARPIQVTQFPEFKVGNFTIRNASVTITELDPELLGKTEKTSAAGLLGAEYLGLHRAVIDLNSLTLYLRPQAKP